MIAGGLVRCSVVLKREEMNLLTFWVVIFSGWNI